MEWSSMRETEGMSLKLYCIYCGLQMSMLEQLEPLSQCVQVTDRTDGILRPSNNAGRIYKI